MDILKQLGKRIIFFEGGMGSILQQNGLAPGELPEVWNVEKPEFILNVHREYLKAGCDIVKTNTFGANSIKMEDSGYTAKELIEKSSFHCKTSSKRKRSWVGCYGYWSNRQTASPIGRFGI